MQIFLAIFLTALGFWLLFVILKALRGVGRRLGQMAQDQPIKLPDPTAEGPITAEGLVHLFSHDFVKPAPRRPIGSISRDRVFACQQDLELDPEDFARQLLYVTLTELLADDSLKTRLVSRDASFMPPYPHKQWEMQLRQTRAFPSSPLSDSFGVSFQLARKNRLRRKSDMEELAEEDDYFTLEEIVERSLKTIRQEMSFWERGTICSDLRSYVETALIAQGFLLQPEKGTWLDTVRQKQPQPNQPAVDSVAHLGKALGRKLETFRKTHGSAFAIKPEQDEKGQLVDIDPAVVNARENLEELPLDDCLRASIHETIVSIKHLEPSGDAGI